EPTNDLDLDTLRILEDFLDEWPGALVVVSHDRALLERTVTDVLVVDGHGHAARRPGGLAAYLAEVTGARVRGKAAARSAAPAAKPGAERSDAGPTPAGAPSKTPSTIRRQLNEAERALRKAVEARDRIAAQLEGAIGDHQRLHALGAELDVAQRTLDEAEERWLALAEEAEEINPGLL
ncbi:MAG TPA: hypothetical protein VFU14_00975, partial [Acidimicrobiales bacterium]|nr:hypothetical protein [Acidimicrobiales bacterium]